jgi:hypothetical protein
VFAINREFFDTMDKGSALLQSVRIYKNTQQMWHAECAVCRKPVETNVYTGQVECTNHFCWCDVKSFTFYPVRMIDQDFINHGNEPAVNIEPFSSLFGLDFIGFLFAEQVGCFENPFDTYMDAVTHTRHY